MSDQGTTEKGGQKIESSSPEIAKTNKLAEALKKFKNIMERVFRRNGKAREVLAEWEKDGSQPPATGSPENGVPPVSVSSEPPSVPAESNPDAKQTPPPVEGNPVQASASSETATQPDGAKPAASTETTPAASATTGAPEAKSDGPTTPADASPATQVKPDGSTTPVGASSSSEDEVKPEEKPVTTQEKLKNLLEARRATVRAALREIALVLLQHKDPLVIMVVQAIGAEETPAGDQLREAILEQAKDACEKSYPKNKLQLPEDIIAQSPLTTEGVSVENTPLADLLVKKLGVKREDLKMEGESVQQQSQRLYEQFMGSRFGAVLGRELFGPDWIKKLDLHNKDIFQLFGRLLHRQGLESFKLGKANELGEMMNAGQDDVQLTKQEKGLFNATLRGIGRQAVWEEFLVKRHGILESPAVHIGLLVFMTILQTAQQSERGGSQGPEH